MKKFTSTPQKLNAIVIAILYSLMMQFANAQNVPELMYFHFDATGSQVNSASAPVGTNPAPFAGSGLTIGTPSQFGTALVGNGVASTNYLNTGWSTNLVSIPWTISFWINNIPSGTTLYYLMGDAGNSMRFFVNGAPGSGNGRLSGTGLPNVDITGITGTTIVLHLVRTTVPNEIKAYKNGVLFSTTPITGTLTTGTGFRVGNYNSTGLNGQMDEFRMYNRALDAAEVAATWNISLPGGPCTSPPTAGTSTATPSSGICTGTNITLNLSGNTFGSGQTYQWQSASAIGGPYSNLGSSQTSSALSTPATSTLYYQCEVTCSGSTATSTPVLVSVNPSFAGGTYTINSGTATGGTNFQTFSDAVAALSCGISGPVILDVVTASGPYNEQVEFPEIGGMSAVNNITINGNNNTLTFAASVSTAPGTFVLNGTDYMTVNNLNIVGTGATYAFACHLWNEADNNAFNNCTFTVPANTTSGTCVPFSITGTASTLATGPSGDNNIITGCTMNSGYYNTVFYGNSTSPNTGNQVINCNIRDQYFYATYMFYQNGLVFKGNILERPTRTTLSTYYGIYVSTGCTNMLVDGNRIRDTWATTPTSTGTQYTIYCAIDASAGNENKFYNNVISDINFNGLIYGMYMSGSDYWQAYHNTISLDQISSTSTSTCYGIYSTGTLAKNARNNIISISRGGTGTKYCIYFSNQTGVLSDYNDLYMNAASGSANYIGYNGTSHATLAAWQSASGYDANSVSVDPLYAAPASYDYTPANGLVNDAGTPLGVTTDINGAARSATTPDMGAYEFSLGGLDASISWVSPTSPATTGLQTITVNIASTQSQTITSLDLSYSDGGAPVTQSFTGLNITGGTNQDLSFTTQYNLTGSVNMSANILSVNGGSDAVSGNNTVNYSLCVALNGIYTINSASATGGSNFQTFNDAVDALSCGILGPVVFNVVSGSGPYNEQVEIVEVTGASSTNTITFNGNGNTLTYAASVSTAPGTFVLNGADYIHVNNLTIEGTGASYALVCHLWNQADNNAFTNCTFNAPANGTNTAQVPFSISGSATSGTTAGVSGDNNVITGCTIFSGYYNTCMVGNSAGNSTGNQLINCNLRDFYFYGSYNYYQTGAIIRGNIIERPTRTTLSTCYGIYVLTGCNSLIVEGNRIRRTWDAVPTSTGTQYSIYCSIDATLGNENVFSNNLISDINFNGTIYGLYMTGSDYWQAYHNTISLDQASATGTTTTYGIYATGTVAKDVRNNIVTISRGGTGTKYCVYYLTPAVTISDYNNLYMNSATGTNYIGYNGTAYATLAAWQSGSGKDANSVSADPLYFNPAGNNYKPTETLVDNIGIPLGVTVDITGALRSPSSPDPGAYEFTVAAKDVGVFDFSGPDAGGCYTNSETIIVTIRNYGTQAIDFSIDPVTVTCDITGQISTSVSAVLSSGTLGIGATMNVPLSPTVDGTANGTYTFNAYTTMASDGEPSNDAFPTFNITVGPVAGTVSSTLNTICVSGNPVLSVSEVYGGAIQWQESTASSSGPWANVGTGMTSYTPGAVTQTTYYRAQTICNTNSATSNVVTVTVNSPAVTSATPGSHCGPGTVTLGATGSSGTTLSWYTTFTGGSPIATGASYTTPSLNNTTDYYVAASSGGGGLQYVGKASITTSASVVGTYYLNFTVSVATTIQSVDCYFNATGSAFTLNIRDAGSLASVFTYSGTTSTSGTVTPQTIPINSSLNPGNYQMGWTTDPGTYRESTGGAYPYTIPGVISITGNTFNDPNYYYYFYNWAVLTGCESLRTTVTATITPPPSINVTAADPAVCPGNSTTVSVNSLNDPSYSYSWSSNPSGFTASGAGPHTVSPTATTQYIVTATDNTAGPNAGCVAIDSVQVITGAALVAGTASASQDAYCNSGAPTLILTGSDGGSIQWQISTAGTSGPWTDVGTGAVYNSPTISQTSYFQAVVSCQSSSVTSNAVTITVSNPSVTSSMGDTRCGYGPVTLQATGSSGTTLNWYDVATGGIPLGTGTSFTTNVSSTTNFYVGAVTGSGGTANATMPAQLTTFTGNVRGYWFTSPADFTITGVNVPMTGTEQSIAIVRFTGAVPPPTFSATTNAFTTLFLTQSNTNTGVIPCNVTVFAGDVIGILGCRGTVTSYGPGTNPTFITIAGQSVGLTRMGMQFPLNTTAPQDLWQEVTATSSIGRIEFTYSTGCESPRTAVTANVTTAPAITASATYYTPCAGNPTDISVSSSNDPNYTYTWTSAPAGFNQNGPGPFTVTPTVNTTYNVTAIDNTGGPNAGCGAFTTVDIVPTSNPLSLSATSTPAAVCPGGNAQLLATPIINGYTMNSNCGTTFIDISSTGTSVGAVTDDSQFGITLPAFTFNGVSYTTALVGSNGAIVLGTNTGTITLTNAALPTTTITAGNIFLAPWWDDLDVNMGGTIKTQTVGSVFIIQWVAVDHNLFTTGTVTFQVQLDLTNGIISFVYPDVIFGSGTYDAGATATVGIQFSSSSAMQYSFNNASLVNGQSICFTPNSPVVTYDWSANPNFLSATNISNPVAQNVTSTQAYTVMVTQTSTGCTKTSNVTLTVNPPPQPLASSNAPVCQGSILTFFGNNLASGQSTGNSWSWSGPSFTSAVQNPTISGATTANAGTYTLTVTNSNGCTASSSHTVVVNPNPVLSIATQTNVSCNGVADGAVDIDANNGTPAYLFDLGGNSTLDGIYTGLAAGTYNASVIDDNGCEATPTLTVTITEPDVLTVAAGSNSPVCTGTALNLTSTPAGGTAGFTFAWTGPNSFTSAVQDPTISSVTAADAGQYDLQITDDHGCIANTNHTVTVIAAPTAAISNFGNNNICLSQPATVTLTFTGTGPWNYTVSDGTQTVSGSTPTSPVNINITPTTAGTHNYTVTAVGNAGCPAGGTSTGTATVFVSTAPPTNNAQAVVPSAPEACSGTVLLVSTNTITGQNVRYSWNTGSNSGSVLYSTNIGGPFSPPPFQTTSPQAYAQFGALAGSSGYSVCVQGTNGCGSGSNKCTWIRGVVSVPGTINPAANAVACANDVKSYSCGTSAGATVYNWTLSGSATPITSGQGTQNVTVTFPAVFTSGQLCVTAALACGGSSTSAPRCMTISNTPAVPGTMTGPAKVCPGATGVVFSVAAVTGATGYNWTVPAGCTITSGTNTPSITVNFPNPYLGAPPVCVSATSACGSSVARCKTVGTNLPGQPGAMSGPTTNICNSTVQYSIPNVPGATSYNWTNPAGTTISSGQGSTTILLSVSSTFSTGQLTVVASTLACTPGNSPPRTISIFGKPNTPANITANPAIWCTGGFVNFSVSPVSPLPVYNWTTTNGTITAGQGTDNIDVTWGATAGGTVNVNASNGCGTSSLRSQGFSSGCREEDEELNVTSNQLSVYPNPAHDNLTVSIDVKENTAFSMQLMDVSGRVVLSQDETGTAGLNTYDLNLTHLSKGVYMLEVKSANDNWKIRVVVE